MILWQSTLVGRSASTPQERIGQNVSVFEEILHCARCGNSEGLSTLYRQFLPAIFGYIATRVPDRSTAEDLTSEVFLKMLEGIHRRSEERRGGKECR